MASQEVHDWWTDVQDARDTLPAGGPRRAVAEWSDDDFDLVPADLMARRPVSGHRFVRTPQQAPRAAQPVPEVAPVRAIEPPREERPRRLELVVEPPRGAGGPIAITGRPEERSRPVVRDDLRRPRAGTRERVAHRPDQVMLWVVALGVLLVLLSFATS